MVRWRPNKPVTLTWDNGPTMVWLTFFRRVLLTINEDYLITVDDSVESRLDAAVALDKVT